MRDRRKKVYLYGVIPYDCEVGFIPVYTAKKKRGMKNGIPFVCSKIVAMVKQVRRTPMACLIICEMETTQSALTLRNRRFFKHEMLKV